MIKPNGDPELLSISRIHEEKNMKTLQTGEKFIYVDMDVVDEHRHSTHVLPKEVWERLKKKYYKEGEMCRGENDLLCNLLDCGIDDIKMIKDCKYDICELAKDYVWKMNEMPDINGIIEGIFLKGRDALDEAVWKESKRLIANGVKEDETPLKELGSLSAYYDMCYEINGFCSYIKFVEGEKLWRRYFQKEIEKVEDDMGIKIGHSFEFLKEQATLTGKAAEHERNR